MIIDGVGGGQDGVRWEMASGVAQQSQISMLFGHSVGQQDLSNVVGLIEGMVVVHMSKRGVE